MISRAQEAEVLRLYHAEHWPIGTIARQLLLHDVQDALMQQAQGCAGRAHLTPSVPALLPQWRDEQLPARTRRGLCFLWGRAKDRTLR